MSEVDGVKAINKVTFGQRLKAYKRSKISFLLAVLVLLSAIITIGVLGYLIFYILIKGVPNLSPDLFSLTYTSENVSMIPAIINTLIMTILALLIAVPLGIFSAIYMVEYAKKGNKNDINNYKNSKNFVKAIKQARNYEKSHERLVIIAGACQSDYEDLIKAGANFASSPKRVNIHALDPAIIASTIALTKTNTQINVPELLEKTKYGSNGMGGIITNGLMYVGYPR